MPGFILASDTQRISTLSGDFVEILHTNAGELGYMRAIGHQDFYPNGGTSQPGCTADPASACSHSRSYFLYADAISGPEPMIGAQCLSNSCFLASGCSNKTAVVAKSTRHNFTSGKFYFITKSHSLYSMGICGIRIGEKNCTY